MIDRTVLGRLQETLGGDPADLAEIIESFMAEAPELIAQMRDAAEQGEQAVLARAAHSLKSNARDLGATVLGELCQAAESSAKTAALTDPRATVAAIATAWEAVAPEFADEMNRIGRSA